MDLDVPSLISQYIKDGNFILRPKGFNPQELKLEILSKLKGYNETLEVCNKMISLAPQNNFFWQKKSEILEEMKNYEDSLVAIDHSISIDHKNIDSWTTKGRLLYAFFQKFFRSL